MIVTGTIEPCPLLTCRVLCSRPFSVRVTSICPLCVRWSDQGCMDVLALGECFAPCLWPWRWRSLDG